MPPKSLKDWMASVRSKPHRDDIIEGLIAAEPGISILGGPAGRGKTNLLLMIAFCIATGRDFLDLKVNRPYTVSYVTFEGSEKKLLARIDKLLKSFDPEIVFKNMAFSREKSLWIDRYYNQLVDLGKGYDLLILDPLKDLCFGDPSKTEIAHQVLQFVKKLSEDTGAHILLGHHVTKPKNEGDLMHPGDMFRLKGSGEYADQSETVMMLERTSSHSMHGYKGRFEAIRSDRVTLYFAKTRDSEEGVEDIDLLFDRNTLLHKIVPPQII